MGLIQRISQLLEITSCFIQAALTKTLEEGYLGGVGLDDYSEDDRNCLKIQGPQLLKMEMVSPNASGLSCASHLCSKSMFVTSLKIRLYNAELKEHEGPVCQLRATVK